MKPFRFTLEAVKTVRLRQEQKAMELYAQTLLAREQAMKTLRQAQQALDAAFNDMRQKLAGGCAAADAHAAANYHKELAKRRDACAEALGTAERRVNASLQAMLAARQQREITDKFHDRQKQRHQKQESVEEQKFLDDLAGRRSGSFFSMNPAEN